MSLFKPIFERIFDLLLPRRCAGCNEIGPLLCNKCIEGVPRAQATPQSFINPLFDYHHPAIKRAVWQLKYENVRGLAESFGERLYEEIIGDLGDNLHISAKASFVVIPIPLHKKRLHERGYNQSELISCAIVKYDTTRMLELKPAGLERIRETKPQAKSDRRAARLKNLSGAFIALPHLVGGKNIILIDDVVTTGATLDEARKALLKAGARSVRAYTIAH